MNKYEKKYNLIEDEKTKRDHKSRRMFCIKDNKLFLAESNLPYSHAVWFEKEGWMDETDDTFMNSVTRGIIDFNGDIYFYQGYDFSTSKEVKDIFFQHFKELVKLLNINKKGKIYSGFVRKKDKWLPIESYGTIKDNLN